MKWIKTSENNVPETLECDVCSGPIINNECPCGIWLDKKDPRVMDFLVYCRTLHIYKFHLDINKVKDIFGCDLPDDDIQMLLFKGSKEENESLKSYLMKLRARPKTD